MRSSESWIFLFLVGLVVFNEPFISIFEGSLPLALFVLWAFFIAAAALFTRRGGRGRST